MSEQSPSTDSFSARTSEPTYYASCTVCAFNTEVDGMDAALDLCDAHREEHGEYHFVEFTRTGHVATAADD